MSIPKKLSYRIKAIQKDLGKTQVQFASDLETHQPVLSFIYNEERDAPGRLLLLLIIKFNVNPHYLAMTSDRMYSKEQDKRTLVTDVREINARLNLMEAQLKGVMDVVYNER